MSKELDENVVVALLRSLERGLTAGLGERRPGGMCVQAAVTQAFGEDFSDRPSCVLPYIRDFLIDLNDQPWSSKEARARGLRELAVAQLGTADMSPATRTELESEFVGLYERRRLVHGNLEAEGEAERDAVLSETARQALEILKRHKTPGCDYLWLTNPRELAPLPEPTAFLAQEKRDLVPVK